MLATRLLLLTLAMAAGAQAQTFCHPDRSDSRAYLNRFLDTPAFAERREEFGVHGVTSRQVQVLYGVPARIRGRAQASSRWTEAQCWRLTYAIVPDPQILLDQGDAYVFYRAGPYYFALSYFLPDVGPVTGISTLWIFDHASQKIGGWSY